MKFNNKNKKKVHFHIIGDLHLWDKNIRSHINYIAECKFTLNKIKSHLKKAREDYPNDLHYLIFLGDIFHKGFNSEEQIFYGLYYQLFLELRSLVDDMFAVVGNHELNFAKGNPFWTLISELEEGLTFNTYYESFGLYPVIRVLKSIEINNSLIQFQHFNTTVDTNELFNNYKNKFLISHEIYMNQSLLSLIESELGENQKYKYIKYSTITDDDPNISPYNECFLGHIHSIIGDWRIRWSNNTTTGLHYLGSQIPVSKDEYLYTPAYRYIKDLMIEPNGDYVIRTDKYLIPPVEKTLRYNQIKKSEISYQKTKEKKELFKKHKNIKFNGQDPIEVLTKEYSNDIEMLDVFQKLETGIKPEILQNRLRFY